MRKQDSSAAAEIEIRAQRDQSNAAIARHDVTAAVATMRDDVRVISSHGSLVDGLPAMARAFGMHAERVEKTHRLAHLAASPRGDRRNLSLRVGDNHAVRHLQERLHDDGRSLAAAGRPDRDEMAIIRIARKRPACGVVAVRNGELSAHR